jgi:hypothetical protein
MSGTHILIRRGERVWEFAYAVGGAGQDFLIQTQAALRPKALVCA